MTAAGDADPLLAERQLESLTWPEVARRQTSGLVLAVPIGSTEQHGPHLPLGTDTDVARELCNRLAAARHEVVAGPPVAFGASGEHEGFPGTVSIGCSALEEMLVELVRSASLWAAGVVLVSAHGGNASALGHATRRLEAEGRRTLGWMARWTGDAHAGRTETSLVLGLGRRPVHLDRAEVGAQASLGTLMPALRAGGLRSVSPNGVLGDPAGASSTEGLALLDQLFDTLARAVAEWWDRAEWSER